METRFYGVLDDVEVIAPANLLEVHEAYVSMASEGIATPGQREVFMRAGSPLGCISLRWTRSGTSIRSAVSTASG